MSAKRIFDIMFSFSFIIATIPVSLLVILGILLNLGTPVFFTQIRPGKDCKPFKIYKFRTMTNSRDSNGNLLPNNLRVTRFGNFLRHSSIDEIPEFYNVLKGDMSIVGPRPLLMDYVGLFNEYQNQRHKVKPGITGWAQVNGRNSITWNDKFKLDVWYVENHSFLIDLKILWQTFIKVLMREGINHDGDVAMPRFTRNQAD